MATPDKIIEVEGAPYKIEYFAGQGRSVPFKIDPKTGIQVVATPEEEAVMRLLEKQAAEIKELKASKKGGK